MQFETVKANDPTLEPVGKVVMYHGSPDAAGKYPIVAPFKTVEWKDNTMPPEDTELFGGIVMEVRATTPGKRPGDTDFDRGWNTCVEAMASRLKEWAAEGTL